MDEVLERAVAYQQAKHLIPLPYSSGTRQPAVGKPTSATPAQLSNA